MPSCDRFSSAHDGVLDTGARGNHGLRPEDGVPKESPLPHERAGTDGDHPLEGNLGFNPRFGMNRQRPLLIGEIAGAAFGIRKHAVSFQIGSRSAKI
jgi:hypothetical protein